MKNPLYWECEKCGHKTPRHPDTKPEEMPLCHQIDRQATTYKCCCGKMIPKEVLTSDKEMIG